MKGLKIKKLLSLILASTMLCQNNFVHCETHAETSKITTIVLATLLGVSGIGVVSLGVHAIHQSNRLKEQEDKIKKQSEAIDELRNSKKTQEECIKEYEKFGQDCLELAYKCKDLASKSLGKQNDQIEQLIAIMQLTSPNAWDTLTENIFSDSRMESISSEYTQRFNRLKMAHRGVAKYYNDCPVNKRDIRNILEATTMNVYPGSPHTKSATVQWLRDCEIYSLTEDNADFENDVREIKDFFRAFFSNFEANSAFIKWIILPALSAQ